MYICIYNMYNMYIYIHICLLVGAICAVKDLDCAELFCGVASVTHGFRVDTQLVSSIRHGI